VTTLTALLVAVLDGVEGKQVTIDLAGDTPSEVRRVNVSAMLRPPIDGDADPDAQNAFSALRSFQILTCDSTATDCAQDGSYQVVFTSAADAFPRGARSARSARR
jgi:extracellular elastinolytic metalloproteinase